MIRMLLALPLALAVAFGLFTFMAYIVDNGNLQAPKEQQKLAFNMVMVEHEQAPQHRQRSVPPPPETPELPPEIESNHSRTATATTVMPLTPVPNLGLDTAIDGIAINMPKFSDFGVAKSQQAMPLYRVEPRYPSRALRQGLQGYVVMKFTIDPQGRPIDISVVESKPARMFDREAKRALSKWKYQPQVVNGSAVAQQGQTAKIEFKLNAQ